MSAFPLTVPQEFLDLYPPESMPRPRLHPNDGYPRHPWLEVMHRMVPVDDTLDDARRRLATACYYGLCSWVDRQVGRVVDALEHNGLADTTRIAYTSDHGDNIGARGMWGKSNHYDDAAGVPLIMAGPDIPKGKVVDTPVSLVILAPTILDAVGEDPYEWSADLLCRDARCSSWPKRRSIPIARSFPNTTRSDLPRPRSCSATGATNTIITSDIRPSCSISRTDPGEERNLAADPAHRETVRRFENKLRSMLDPEAIDARAKADQAVLIARHGGPEKAIYVGAPGATPAPV